MPKCSCCTKSAVPNERSGECARHASREAHGARCASLILCALFVCELSFSYLSLFCMKMNSGLISTVVQVAMELMDSDSDEEYDDLVATIAMK